MPLRNELPVFDIEKRVEVAEAVDEPIAKSVVFVEPLLAWMAKLPKGVEVPRPTLPV